MKSAPLTVTSVIDSVEASLRQQILDQDIEMGAAVKESDVAQAFAVARPTAKAAIERLVSAGLLRRDVHKSARVPTLNVDDVADLYFSRSILESEMARELAQLGEPPDRAATHIAALRAVPTDAAPAQFVEPDIAFHTSLAQHLNSRRVGQIHAGLLQETRLCMAQVQAHHLLDPQIIVGEHERILEAIAAGDADAAARATRQHLQRARDALVGYLRDETEV